MDPATDVEVADRMSWKRVWIIALTAAVFLIVQLVASPLFPRDTSGDGVPRVGMWLINVIALLLILATGGGLLNRRTLRALVNDDVSRAHRRRATELGFWTAMVTGLAIFICAPLLPLAGRQAVYLVISVSILIALGAFSYLEWRAHADA